MAERADVLPFSVANILKVDLKVHQAATRKQGQSSASKALTLAERLADVIMDAKTNADGGHLQKRRRTRTAFTQYQLATLENAFLHTHYPDVVMREKLTIWTQLPDSTVQIWFKNRRAKFRKKKRTYCLQFNKEKNEDDTNNTIPVSPVCWPPVFPTLAPRGNTPSETQQLSGEKIQRLRVGPAAALCRMIHAAAGNSGGQEARSSLQLNTQTVAKKDYGQQ